jgi:hypothetical protein
MSGAVLYIDHTKRKPEQYKYLIGKSLEQARKLLDDDEFVITTLRVIEQDGKKVEIQSDLRYHRLNVKVNCGVITAIDKFY